MSLTCSLIVSAGLTHVKWDVGEDIAAQPHNKYNPPRPFVQRGRVSLRPLERTALYALYNTSESAPGIIGAEPNIAYAAARNECDVRN